MNNTSGGKPSPNHKYKFPIIAYAVVIATVITIILSLFPGRPKGKEGSTLRMASTTSVEGSGLLDALLPAFEAQYGIEVRYLAVGTGQAIRIGMDGNADILFLHDQEREKEFMEQGYGEKRVEIMENFFMLAGPEKYYHELCCRDICDIMQAIAERELPFVSRGDESGTHAREKYLWRVSGITEKGDWVIDAGSGMVETLRVASARSAFVLTDSSTWLVHRDRLNLIPYVTEGEHLRNVYSLIIMNRERYPDTDTEKAELFLNFVLNEKGRDIVAKHGKDEFGSPLFNWLEPTR